ncbi:MAG TPA: 30S ribosomal protein THX [Bacteroidia bacterium]|jgi:30S ribosomal protein S31|nr:30S ribosomal protein THX [Bacteroidia bacterium]
MGKGDKRSRKGKVWRGSYGKSRPQKDTTTPKFVAKPKPKKVAAPAAEETLFDVPVVEGAEAKAAKPKKAAAPKKPKVEGEKKAPAKPKKKVEETPEAESATEEKTEE